MTRKATVLGYNQPLVPRGMDKRTCELTMLIYKMEQNNQTIKECDSNGHSLRSQATFGTKSNVQEIRGTNYANIQDGTKQANDKGI